VLNNRTTPIAVMLQGCLFWCIRLSTSTVG